MIRARASLIVAGAVSAGAAIWFGSTWLDPKQGDSTCSNLWHPGRWMHVHGCQAPMTIRLVIAVMLAGFALGAFWLSATKPPPRALLISVAIVIIAAGALVVNENIRTQGRWSGAVSPAASARPAHPARD